MPTPVALNAVDYGMVPNTGTDQTSNFQAAIDAAQNQGLPLFIPGGTYDITTVNVTSDVEIYGSRRAPILLGLNQAPQINIAPVPPNDYINVVRIFGITIDGQNQSFPGSPSDAGLIQSSGVGNLFIEECFINQSSMHGLYVLNSTGSILSNTIGSSEIFGIFSLDSTFLIQGNSVNSSGNGGILVWRSSPSGDNSIVARNSIGQTGANLGGTGQYGNAVSVFRANFVLVANNSIFGATFSGVRLNASSYCQVLGNNCYGCGENTIYIEAPGSGSDSFVGGIVANNIIDTTGGGVSVTNTTNGGHRVVVSNNQITNVVIQTVLPGYLSTGRGLQGEGDVLFVGNQIEDVEDWAITLVPFAIGSTKTIAQAESNMIKNCAGGIGFVQDNTDTALFIGGNTIYDYTTTTKYAAIVACSYNGSTGDISRLSGSTDLGNATSSGFTNVKLLLNYSFN